MKRKEIEMILFKKAKMRHPNIGDHMIMKEIKQLLDAEGVK